MKVIDISKTFKKAFDDDFQRMLLNQVISNLKRNETEYPFGDNVITELEPNAFTLKNGAEIVHILQDFHRQYGHLPTNGFENLKVLTKSLSMKYGVQKTNAIVRELKLIEESATGISNTVRKSFTNFMDLSYVNDMYKVLDDVTKNETYDISLLTEIGEISKRLVEKREHKKYKEYDFFDLQDQIFHKQSAACLSSGLGERFDEIMGGGFYKGKNITFIMPKNTGKTTFACKIGTQWALKHDQKVLHFFWEDSEVEIAQKIASSVLNVSLMDIPLLKNYKSSIQYEKLEELKKTRQGNYKLVRCTYGMSVQDIINLTYKYVEQGFKPSMIILDYFKKLSKIKGKKYDNNYEYLGEAATLMTDLVDKDNLNCSGIFFQQSDRSSMSEEKVHDNQVKGDIELLYPAHGVITVAANDIMKTENRVNLTLARYRGQYAGTEIKDMFMDGSKMQIDSYNASDPNWKERTLDYWQRLGVAV